MSCKRPVAPWRRLCLYGGGVALLLLSWTSQRALLGYDPEQSELLFFGLSLPIEDFHLLLLLSLTLLFAFLLAALVLGRVWCGWFCPQTALTDLGEGLARRLGLTVAASRLSGPWTRHLVFHCFCLVSAVLAAAGLLWLFMPPQRFFTELFALSLPVPAGAFLLVAILVLYVDLAFIGRRACRTICPYGRFQEALAERGTLTLRFAPAIGERCTNCRACVRACPIDLDIRAGGQGECINCGRCLDACRAAMQAHQQSGLIHYAFGERGAPAFPAILNARTLLVATALLVTSALLLTASLQRPLAELSVVRTPGAVGAVRDGGVIFFSAQLINRGNTDKQFSLSARLVDGTSLPLLGPVRDLHLRAGEKRRVDFALLPPPDRPPGTVPFDLLLSDADDKVILLRRAFFPMEEHR